MQNQILRNCGWVVLLFLLTTLASQAQVKVGDSPTTLNEGAVLEMQSTNRGMLLPRINLANTTTWGLNGTNPVKNGMVVYNTNALIVGSATYPAAGVGTYTFDGTGWVFSNVPKGGTAGQVLSKNSSNELVWNSPASGVMTYALPGSTGTTGLTVTATGPGVTYSINPSLQTVTVTVPTGVRLLSLRSLETATTTGVNASGSILKYVIETAAADGINTSFLNATLPQVQFYNFALNPKAFTNRAIRFDSAADNKLTISITAMDSFTQYLFLFNF